MMFLTFQSSHVPSYIYIRIYSRIRHNIALGYRHQLCFFFFVFITYHELSCLVSKKKSARATGRQLLQTRTPKCSKNRESESRTMKNNEAPVTSTRFQRMYRSRRKYTSNATVFYKYTFVQLYCTVGTLLKRGPTYMQKFLKIRRTFLFLSHASIV